MKWWLPLVTCEHEVYFVHNYTSTSCMCLRGVCSYSARTRARARSLAVKTTLAI